MGTYTCGKKYPCNQYLKWFSNRSNLNAHMVTHTCEKKYPCNQCLKWFSDRSKFNAHMGTRTCGENVLATYVLNDFPIIVT